MDNLRRKRRTGRRAVVFLLVALLGPLAAACRMPPFNPDLSLERAGVDDSGSNGSDPSAPAPTRFLLFQGQNSDKTVVFDAESMTATSGPSPARLVGPYAEARRIGSGPREGEYWILFDNGSWTTFFDPDTVGFTAGPDLSASFDSNSHSWTVSSGTHAGKIMVFIGGDIGVTVSERYDPATDALEASPPNTFEPGGSGPHTHSFVSTLTGRRIIILAQSATANDALVYDPVADDFPATATFLAGAQAGPGSHSILHDDGTVRVILGGGTPDTEVFDPLSGSFTSSAVFPTSLGAGAHSFPIQGGPNDSEYLVVAGGGSNNTLFYNPTSRAVQSGPSLSGNAGRGSSAIRLAAGPETGKYLIVHGENSDTTSIFDPQNPTVAMPAGPVLTDLINNSIVIPIE